MRLTRYEDMSIYYGPDDTIVWQIEPNDYERDEWVTLERQFVESLPDDTTFYEPGDPRGEMTKSEWLEAWRSTPADDE